MIVLGLDPGPVKSALVAWDGKCVLGHCLLENNEMLDRLLVWALRCPVLVIEQIKSYGMSVADSIFDTVFWSGRFAQFWGEYERLPRMDVKMHLCHKASANDSNIRQAILDRFGGKEQAIGKKACPGPLYGISGDEWAALAVALTWHDQNCTGEKRQ